MARTTTSGLPPVEKIVGKLYGCLAERVGMEESLEALGAIFRTHVTGLHMDDLSEGSARYPVLVGNLDTSALGSIAHEYTVRAPTENLWMSRSTAGYLHQGYQYGEAVVGDAELLSSPYYLHYLKPADIRHGMGICLTHAGGTRFTVLSLNRARTAGPFGEPDFALVRLLRPHLLNHYSLYRRLTKADALASTLSATLDRLSIAAMVLDAQGLVSYANDAAEGLLTAGKLLSRSRSGSLIASDRRTRAKLHAAFQLVLRVAGAKSVSLRISAPGTSLEQSMGAVIHVYALPSGTLGQHAGQVLVLLTDLVAPPSSHDRQSMLEITLGATRAEARAALALLQHHDVAASAASLGITINTLKTHLKHLFQKTETSRQSELLLLVERVLGPARPTRL